MQVAAPTTDAVSPSTSAWRKQEVCEGTGWMRSEVDPSDQVTLSVMGDVLGCPPQDVVWVPAVGAQIPVKRVRSLPSDPPPQAPAVKSEATSKVLNEFRMISSPVLWL